MIVEDALSKARDCLASVTPLKADCGRYCGGACCLGDDTGKNGMLLFPGEERFYEGCSWAEILPDRLGKRFCCRGICPRDKRPLACRIFPLVILLAGKEEPDFKAKVIMDVRAWPVCPLMESGKSGLQSAFVQAVEEAADLLMADERQRRFLRALADEIRTYRDMKHAFLSGRDT